MAELLHLHQHAEYVTEDGTRDGGEDCGDDTGVRVGAQASGPGQSQYRPVGFRRLANKKNFSLTENSVSTTKDYF